MTGAVANVWPVLAKLDNHLANSGRCWPTSHARVPPPNRGTCFACACDSLGVLRPPSPPGPPSVRARCLPGAGGRETIGKARSDARRVEWHLFRQNGHEGAYSHPPCKHATRLIWTCCAPQHLVDVCLSRPDGDHNQFVNRCDSAQGAQKQAWVESNVPTTVLALTHMLGSSGEHTTWIAYHLTLCTNQLTRMLHWSLSRAVSHQLTR